jgi:3-oxoacyl-[acyl-carrier protein] reductase
LAIVKRITSKGGKAIAVQAEVSKPQDITRLFAETKKAYGKLDILVNNAGIYEFAPLESVTPQHFHKQFDLNVLGLLLTTQEAVKHMNGAGRSIGAFRKFCNCSPGAAKRANSSGFSRRKFVNAA